MGWVVKRLTAAARHSAASEQCEQMLEMLWDEYSLPQRSIYNSSDHSDTHCSILSRHSRKAWQDRTKRLYAQRTADRHNEYISTNCSVLWSRVKVIVWTTDSFRGLLFACFCWKFSKSEGLCGLAPIRVSKWRVRDQRRSSCCITRFMSESYLRRSDWGKWHVSVSQ